MSFTIQSCNIHILWLNREMEMVDKCDSAYVLLVCEIEACKMLNGADRITEDCINLYKG